MKTFLYPLSKKKRVLEGEICFFRSLVKHQEHKVSFGLSASAVCLKSAC